MEKLKNKMADLKTLGLNKELYREDVEEDILTSPQAVAGGSETPTESLVSGEIDGDISFVGGFIQSKNFVTGSTGWRLTAGGNFEASAGTFRGSLIAGSIDIPDTSTANSFHTDSSGNSWWGATTLDDSLASITAAGIALFQGSSVLETVGMTVFETAARFRTDVIGSGVVTFGNQGVNIQTSATISSSAKVRWDGFPNMGAVGTFWSLSMSISALVTSHESIFGIGNPTVTASGITFTDSHMGFKIVGGNLIATQATGGSETVSGTLTTASSSNKFDLVLRVAASNSVEYWYQKNNAGWVLGATLTTNQPAATSLTIYAVTNVDTAAQTQFQLFASTIKY